MKVFQLCLASIFVLAFTSSANAQGIYVGGSLNSTSHTTESNISLGRSDGWRLQLGYDINPYLMVEASYLDTRPAIKNVSLSTVSMAGKYTSLSALGTLGFGQSFVAFAKLGYFDGTTTYQSRNHIGVSNPFHFEADDSGLVAGAGLMFVEGRFAWRIDYEWFDVDFGSVRSVGFGLNYKF